MNELLSRLGMKEISPFFHFVFHRTVETVTEDVIASLPENHSLERGRKVLYAGGGFLHELGGLIPF